MSYLMKLMKNQEMKQKGNIIYGKYNHYPTVATMGNGDRSRIVTVSYCADASTKDAMEMSMRSQLTPLFNSNKKLKDYHFNQHSIEFTVLPMMTEKGQGKLIIEVLDIITNVLRQNGFTSGCTMCGTDAKLEWYSVGSSPVCICDTCRGTVMQAAKAEQEELENTDPNYIMGLIGAVLGTLAAGAIFVLILQLNRILISFLLPLIPFGLYSVMGKKVTWFGSISTGIIYLVGFFLAVKLGMVWYISREAELDFTAVWRDLSYFVDQYKSISEYYWKVIIEGYGISAVVAVIAAIAVPISSGKSSVKKM